jgi:hypothetical protein
MNDRPIQMPFDAAIHLPTGPEPTSKPWLSSTPQFQPTAQQEQAEHIDLAAEFEKIRKENLDGLAHDALVYLREQMPVADVIAILHLRRGRDFPDAGQIISDTVNHAVQLVAKASKPREKSK